MAKKNDKSLVPYDKVEFSALVAQIKDLIRQHRTNAWRHVNNELMSLYWTIGQEIVIRQETKGWGDAVVEDLSKELKKEFPGERGYSARNLWKMRNFFLDYAGTNFLPMPSAESSGVKLPMLLAEISWSHNYTIMEKCKDKSEREFYVKMTKRYGWTHEVLLNNIENKAFEKYLLNQTNFDETVPEKYRQQAKLAVKDDYNLEFIEIGLGHSERELEAGIISNLRAFLKEMGGHHFGFIDSQFHLDVAGEDYYIDLLLTHRRLHCLVAIDLKIGEFKPEYAGKMQFYLNALDEKVKLPEENPSIGIIICKSKNRTRVEYTLKSSTKPIGVATYSFYDSMPKNLKEILPPPKEIEEIIGRIGSSDDND